MSAACQKENTDSKVSGKMATIGGVGICTTMQGAQPSEDNEVACASHDGCGSQGYSVLAISNCDSSDFPFVVQSWDAADADELVEVVAEEVADFSLCGTGKAESDTEAKTGNNIEEWHVLCGQCADRA